MAEGSGVGRGKGVWGREEARESKGGAWKWLSRGGGGFAVGRGLEWTLGGSKGV